MCGLIYYLTIIIFRCCRVLVMLGKVSTRGGLLTSFNSAVIELPTSSPIKSRNRLSACHPFHIPRSNNYRVWNEACDENNNIPILIGHDGHSQQRNYCTRWVMYFSLSKNCLFYIFFDLKYGRTSAHIFPICLVQNCLSQVKIYETVYSLSGFWNWLA